MLTLNPKHASLLYGIIPAAITSAVATGIANYQLIGFGFEFLFNWGRSRVIAWLMMLPVVILVSPLIQRTVLSLSARP